MFLNAESENRCADFKSTGYNVEVCIKQGNSLTFNTVIIKTKLFDVWQLPRTENWYNLRTHEQITSNTRKLCYRKDDRAMRHILLPWKFSGVPDYAHGYFSRIFNGLFFRLMLWIQGRSRRSGHGRTTFSAAHANLNCDASNLFRIRDWHQSRWPWMPWTACYKFKLSRNFALLRIFVRPIYQECRALTFALARLSCIYRASKRLHRWFRRVKAS